MIPKSGTPFTSAWNFQIALNIITPIVLLGLGLIMPILARRNKEEA
jgi:hypothetical protein